MAIQQRRIAAHWARNADLRDISIARDLAAARDRIELRDEQARLKREAADRRGSSAPND